MSRQLGHDLTDVQIHTGASADMLTKAVGARAVTYHDDIAFRHGHYRPGTEMGDRLLAHELTHVVQFSNASETGVPRTVSRATDASEREASHVAERVSTNGTVPPSPLSVRAPASSLQRSISIAGEDYVPNKKYLKYLKENFGNAMVDFMLSMDNGGDPPEYEFDSKEQMGYEVRIRAAALKKMKRANSNGSDCCNYPSDASADPYGTLNPKYWVRKKPFTFVMKNPLPAGKQPSDAVKAIFKSKAGTELDCNSMMVAVQYRAMLESMGAKKFNKRFAGGVDLVIGPVDKPLGLLAPHPLKNNIYKSVFVGGAKELLPGDWVYFRNKKDYLVHNPGGLWSGEHTLYVGAGEFEGFGAPPRTAVEMFKTLASAYNEGVTDPANEIDWKNDEIIMSQNVRRPAMNEIIK